MLKLMAVKRETPPALRELAKLEAQRLSQLAAEYVHIAMLRHLAARLILQAEYAREYSEAA